MRFPSGASAVKQPGLLGAGKQGEARASVGELLRRAGEGEERAWTEVVHQYSGRVYGLLLKRCGDPDLAEEITQATFTKVVANFSSKDRGYEEQGKFKPWLFRVALNNLRDELRRRGREAIPVDLNADGRQSDSARGWGGAGEQEVLQASAGHAGLSGSNPPAEDPLQSLDRAEQVQRLQTMIQQLPEADQQVLEMRHTSGLSFNEIAQTLKQPLGTVLARSHRAMGKLRKMMNQQDAKQVQT